MKYRTQLVCSVLSVCCLSACGDKKSQIVGEWQCGYNGQGNNSTMLYTKRFESDGSWETYGGDTTNYKGTYSIDGDRLIVDYYNPSYPTNGTTNTATTIVSVDNSKLVTQSSYGSEECRK